MKDGSTIKNRGVSTLEIIIALAILSITFAALILLSFSNSSLALDSDLNNHGLAVAREEFEILRGESFSDFNNLVSATSTIIGQDGDPYSGLYSKDISVSSITPCRKKVSETISWQADSRPQGITFASFFGSPSVLSQLGNDCGGEMSAAKDWSKITETSAVSNLPSAITGLDMKNGIAYMTASTGSTTANFFAYNTKNSNFSSLIAGNGFQALDVAQNYAYVGNASSTDQLQVIDIGDPENLKLISCDQACTLLGSNKPGQSIFYFDGKVYIGTDYSPSSHSAELHIFDVSDPANPVEIGNLKVWHSVNAIAVSNQFIDGVEKTICYLALSSTDASMPELEAFDVTSPTLEMDAKTNTLPLGFFNPPGTEYGTALFLIGNKLYLGRQGQGLSKTTESEFFILDVTDPKNIHEIEHANLNLSTTDGVYVSAIRAFENIVFIASTYSKKPIFEYDSNAHQMISISPWASFGVNGMDIENNQLYEVGSKGLHIFSPQ
ncbi:MAG: hypothetical protein PHV42_00145 [Candidatus Pacebacteria bacterium]|nr:hypothetical protein [Candidatus Paceibacterota bacterium]